ncbi:5-oxoprolinase subunit PxpB [Dyella sp. ASV21]|uniref:5-oxoprolinase subunit PxpB n=1 Tax=Dyella sp. ASV21 TaxID=2795114 RepID=UPI001E32F02F|nr:5-oxoprolinase subunit PxpB [Dyella sp. ASV21]
MAWVHDDAATAETIAPHACRCCRPDSPPRLTGVRGLISPSPMPPWEPLAEDALLLRFGEVIDAALNARVHAAAALLRHQLHGVECVPAYASLLLRFEPAQWEPTAHASSWQRVAEAVRAVLQMPVPVQENPREVELPVLYGGDCGPDLATVASYAGLSEAEVVARHCAGRYRVAMLGFAPGFPYLLGLDPALASPRRAKPRLSVPAGSVAIGGQQTGVYPQALPGGWQVIGRTPLSLFDMRAESPARLCPGDGVRFRAIDQAEFARLSAMPEADR